MKKIIDFVEKLLMLTAFTFLSVVPVFAESSNGSGKKNGSYCAGEKALNILQEKNDFYSIEKTKKGDYIFTPVENDYSAGFIFYPGGKVECEAYLPIVQALAEEGYLSILVHMPSDLAIFNKNGAAKFQKQFPEIDYWFIGGHSLGGAMAGDFVSSHADSIDGLILLAAYSQKKIDENMPVLSIYGSCDKVLSSKNYEKYKKNLPEGYKEIIIEGGCHSYFGDYGNQAGDGEPEITREEELDITINEILSFIEQNLN